MPSTPPSVTARLSKALEQIIAVGRPRRSSSTVSWTLHDVQEPQSPIAVTTHSASAASASMASSGAGPVGYSFRRAITGTIP